MLKLATGPTLRSDISVVRTKQTSPCCENNTKPQLLHQGWRRSFRHMRKDGDANAMERQDEKCRLLAGGDCWETKRAVRMEDQREPAPPPPWRSHVQ